MSNDNEQLHICGVNSHILASN